MRRSLPILALALAIAIVLSGCGKTSTPSNAPVANTPNQGNAQPPALPPPPPPPPSGSGSAPLSYEISKVGGSAVFETSSISTDNILRVRYEVGPAGNQFFDATDVRVEITVNGTMKVPHYSTDPACPTGGCEYGRPSDGASDILDFSATIQPGVPVTVKVTQARYNWYCYSGLYPGGNPVWSPYNGCNYRLVQDPQPSIGFPGHYWKGRLIVQTNATNAAIFQGNNP